MPNESLNLDNPFQAGAVELAPELTMGDVALGLVALALALVLVCMLPA